ncbi:hypothetical protein RUM43_012038 [Polyplax serrata]|uniref:O-acyltransferase n=1 Tax=Polyplax serrata TaxID=468196 RepID=A0AAN8P676_POLSC
MGSQDLYYVPTDQNSSVECKKGSDWWLSPSLVYVKEVVGDSTAVNDIIKHGEINIGFKLIYWNFQSLPLASLIWLGMQTSTIAVYFVFQFWADNRHLSPKTLSPKSWDIFYFLFMVIYQILFLIIPASAVIHHRLAIAISFAILLEQTRFLMKTYSFLREAVPRVLRKTRNDPLPTLKMYTYFLFAPTLVYRDEYPRTSRIRWKIVVQHATEIIGVIFYLAFIMDNYLIPSVKNFGKVQMTLPELLTIFFNNNVPCVLVLLCGFYCFLHSWLNGSAELLRFADRMFYQDWWNSSSFAEYYKTWNVVVHDWLYAFVYKDATEMLTNRKTVSTWMVFLISALFHEYILALTFKFCYPVLFVVFGFIGTGLVFIPKKRSSAVGNMLLWLGIFTGTGCCGSLYMLEYYARINCPVPNVSTT